MRKFTILSIMICLLLTLGMLVVKDSSAIENKEITKKDLEQYYNDFNNTYKSLAILKEKVQSKDISFDEKFILAVKARIGVNQVSEKFLEDSPNIKKQGPDFEVIDSYGHLIIKDLNNAMNYLSLFITDTTISEEDQAKYLEKAQRFLGDTNFDLGTFKKYVNQLQQ